MTKITLKRPSTGEKDSVAEPLVSTAIKEVEEFLNGQKIESTDNIKPEGIAEASLSKALQEKLTTKLGLKLEIKNESLTGVSEVFYEMEKEGSTLELPAPTLNRMIGIGTNSVINAVKVKAKEGKIFSPQHQAGATTVEVTKLSPIIVLADGSNWLRIAGEEKSEQAYGARTKRASGAEVEPSATRPAFVTGWVLIESGKTGTIKIGAEEVIQMLQTSGVSAKVPFFFYVPVGLKYKFEVEGASEIWTSTLLN